MSAELVTLFGDMRSIRIILNQLTKTPNMLENLASIDISEQSLTQLTSISTRYNEIRIAIEVFLSHFNNSKEHFRVQAFRAIYFRN